MSGHAPLRAFVVGYGLSGRAAAHWLAGHGWEVSVIEDGSRPGPSPAAVAGAVPQFGGGAEIEVEYVPSSARVAQLAAQVDLVVPSPGVPVAHVALAAARSAGVEICGEVELAWRELVLLREEVGNARYPLVAVTGTNGKTTVTELVTAMLAASGLTAVAAGNLGVPLVEAVARLETGAGTVLVAEVSSFQLEHTHRFRPDVSCWLNFSPDHLDWHPDLDHYARAKARVWANQGPGCTAVVNAGDPVVAKAVASVPEGVRVVAFGPGPVPGATLGTAAAAPPAWTVAPDGVYGPSGLFLAAPELPRAFPHDLANTAAAVAVALAAGASEEGCRQAARSTPAPAHRLELVARAAGISWYDDSKATTPASVQAAVAGFSSVVLLAGGRNKGLDLAVLAATAPPVRAVVAIGEAAPEVETAFAAVVPVQRAGSMQEAVDRAAALARPGDAVVLSPGCASFDWYSSYAERGKHFSALVKEKLREVGEP